MTKKLNLNNGLDKSGDAVMAFLDPSVAGGDSDDAILVLWPVTDYKAFVSNFGDAKEENGITEVQLPDTPKPAYLANWGKYAAMSPSKDIVALKPTGLKVSGLAEKELMTKDVVLVANMPKLKALLQPKLKDGRDQLMTQMQQGLSSDPNAANMLGDQGCDERDAEPRRFVPDRCNRGQREFELWRHGDQFDVDGGVCSGQLCRQHRQAGEEHRSAAAGRNSGWEIPVLADWSMTRMWPTRCLTIW